MNRFRRWASHRLAAGSLANGAFDDPSKVRGNNEGGKRTMETISKVKAGTLLAALFLATMALSAPVEKTDPVTISGEVAATYDDDGTVNGVYIYDDEWGSVIVRKNGKGAELRKHLGAIVSATGRMRELGEEESGYDYSIVVTGYTIDQPGEPREESDEELPGGPKSSADSTGGFRS